MEKTIINTQEEFDKLTYKNPNGGNFFNYTLENAIINCEIKFPKIAVQQRLIIQFTNVEVNQTDFCDSLNKVIFEFQLNSCVFHSKINMQGKTIDKLIIDDCSFEKEVNFSNSIFQTTLSITGNKFLSSAIFSECKYHCINTIITQNSFYVDTSFIKNVFNKNLNLEFNSFYDGVDFEYSIFKGKLNAWGITGHNNLINFSRVIFHEDSFLTQSHFYGGISLYATIIKSILEITDIKVYGNNSDSETLRIIKNLHSKQDNRRQALVFHEMEMNAYMNEIKDFLKNCKKPNYNNKKTSIEKPEMINLENLKVHNEINLNFLSEYEYKEAKKHYNRDYIILRLNELSNNFGLSWFKGLMFVLKSSIITYSIYVLSFIILNNYPYEFGWINWNEFLKSVDYFFKNYFQFLWPTHKFDFMEGTKSTSLNYFIDILSRIIIGFGIYQMIQAFRKFGKI